jgi:hypothetical protein
MRRRVQRDPSPAVAAACGAAAGLIGGLALTALDRVVAPRLGEAGERERRWDEAVGDVLSRLGLHLNPRNRAIAGIAAGLTYAALLGAGYGLARRRWKTSSATLGLLDAALVYAASAVSPEPRRKPRSTRRRSARSTAIHALSSVSVFGTATAAAYNALSRRVG